MARYIVSRFLQLLVMLVVASTIVFAVIQNSPGDPAMMQLGLDATPEQVEVERVRLGLDRSIMERYVIWMSDALRFDFGVSFATGLPVAGLLLTALGYTIRLAAIAAALAVLAGTTLGITAAINRGNRIDSAISGFSALGLSLPSFALGTILIIIFAINLRWLPPSGVGFSSQSFLQGVSYMVMPSITLALPFTVTLTRFVRASMIEAMSQDYITTARAKGMTQRTVVLRHALRNALIPAITIIGIQTGHLLAGATVTETIFSYPGLGRLTIEAVQGLDYPVVQGALLLSACLFLVNTFIVDLAYGQVDPRVKIGRDK